MITNVLVSKAKSRSAGNSLVRLVPARRTIEELESTYVAPSPKPAMAERGKASADERAGKENSQP